MSSAMRRAVHNSLGQPWALALQKHAFELPLLLGVESGGRSRMGPGSQAFGGTRLFEPAENGALMDTYDARDILYLVARMNGLHGLASSLLQSAGGSVRSAHDSFYADRQLRAIGSAAVNNSDSTRGNAPFGDKNEMAVTPNQSPNRPTSVEKTPRKP
jgi:hypothetical protein